MAARAPARAHVCRYVAGSFSWLEAEADALSNGGVLAPILDESYHDASVELLALNNVAQAWLGAVGSLQHNPNAWEWITRKCMILVTFVKCRAFIRVMFQ